MTIDRRPDFWKDKPAGDKERKPGIPTLQNREGKPLVPPLLAPEMRQPKRDPEVEKAIAFFLAKYEVKLKGGGILLPHRLQFETDLRAFLSARPKGDQE